MAAITHRLRCEMLEKRDLSAADVGDSMALTVDSENTEGLRAAQVQIHFDTRTLELDATKIRAGDAWGGQASVVAEVDESAGLANIFLFTAEPIAAVKGKLVDIQFDVRDELAADVSSAGVAQLRLNEGAIPATAQLSVPTPRACVPWQAPDLVELTPDASPSSNLNYGPVLVDSLSRRALAPVP